MISFEVPGIPVAQGNHRIGASGHLYDSAKGLDQWRKDVAQVARITWRSRAPLQTAVSLVIAFKIKASNKELALIERGIIPPATKYPDTSKLVRAVEDALSEIIYEDDSQVVHVEASKVLTRERATGAIIFLEWAGATHHYAAIIAGGGCELCGKPMTHSEHYVAEARGARRVKAMSR